MVRKVDYTTTVSAFDSHKMPHTYAKLSFSLSNKTLLKTIDFHTHIIANLPVFENLLVLKFKIKKKHLLRVAENQNRSNVTNL